MKPKPSRQTASKYGLQTNLSRTVGLTGTKRNARRGRGGGIQRAKLDVNHLNVLYLDVDEQENSLLLKT